MILPLVLSSFLANLISAQTSCLDDGNKGPNINGGCPTNDLTPTDDGFCCQQGFIVDLSPVIEDTTTPEASIIVTVPGGGATVLPVTASTNCQDKVNPRTGTSDCVQRSSLCNDKVYFSLMTQQCPKTCGRCSSSGATTNSTCQDMLNPRTGTSDCGSLSYLCKDSNYLYVMKCPKTCNLCSTNVTAPAGGCVDLINPMTNTSDCPRLKSLCKDAVYLAVMQKQCPKTCGFCSG